MKIIAPAANERPIGNIVVAIETAKAPRTPKIGSTIPL